MDEQTAGSEPRLADRTTRPRGVLHKNAKVFIYLGAVALIVLAMIFGGSKKRPAAGSAASQASVTDSNTANNVAALQAQLAANRMSQAQQQPQAPMSPEALAPVQGTVSGYGPQPAMGAQVQPNAGANTISPEEQEAQQLAQKERERLYASRFESNLVYSASAQQGQEARQQSLPAAQGLEQNLGKSLGQGAGSRLEPSQPTSLVAPRAAGEPPADQQSSYKRAAEVNLDAAVGQPYVIYEGTTLDTVLMNRLDGDSVGPVKVLVSTPLYSHDHQHVLVPDGSVVLGDARKVGNSGFGQQRRIAVIFHRLIMPDGYSVDLDQFHGLDQIGEAALKDKVNNHYLEIFGTSIALGIISGAAQITEGGTGYNSNGSQAFVDGASAGVSQQAITILDRFIQIPPTITIREGHRVKVYISQDMLLPAYANHAIAQTF